MAAEVELAALKDRSQQIKGTSIPIMRELPPDQRRSTFTFVRGLWLDKGDEVQPGTPAALPPLTCGRTAYAAHPGAVVGFGIESAHGPGHGQSEFGSNSSAWESSRRPKTSARRAQRRRTQSCSITWHSVFETSITGG